MKKSPNQHALRTCKNTRTASFWENCVAATRVLCWQRFLLFSPLYELILNSHLHYQRSGKICMNSSKARKILTARMIMKWLMWWIWPEMGLPRTTLWYQAGSRCLRSVRWGHRLILPMGQHSQAIMSSHLRISKWIINELTLALCNRFICLSPSLMKCSCMHIKIHLVPSINVGAAINSSAGFI